jgi:hypothetical protein
LVFCESFIGLGNILKQASRESQRELLSQQEITDQDQVGCANIFERQCTIAIPALLFPLKEGIFSRQKSFSVASTAKGKLTWQMTLLIY